MDLDPRSKAFRRPRFAPLERSQIARTGGGSDALPAVTAISPIPNGLSIEEGPRTGTLRDLIEAQAEGESQVLR